MKTLKIILMVLLVGFFLSFSASASTEVNMDFSISINCGGLTTEVVFEPWTPGIPGDGFMMSYRGRDYFLQEGQSLRLPNNKFHLLYVSRAYMTSEGLVVGNGQSITLNSGKEEARTKQNLNLPLIKKAPKGWMLAPKIYADFSFKKIKITPYIYGGPPVAFSRVEAVFSGYPESVFTRMVSYPEDWEIADIPRGYSLFKVALIFDDTANNRIIKGESSSLNFIME